MKMWIKSLFWRPSLALAVAGLLSSVPSDAGAHASAEFSADKLRAEREHLLPDTLPERPTIPPAFNIPVEPLGFSPPGPIYLGQRNALVSLDFLDEDHLLFTFRVPGLIRRQAEDAAGDYERQIRAVVLALPTGRVQAEALWKVHDRTRYLWMLNDGHFLFRDRDTLQLGDATLELQPFLHFPGPLLWLGLDPTRELIVTNSDEPVATVSKSGDVAGASSARVNAFEDAQNPVGQPELVLRILRRDSGKVMLVTRVRTPVRLPINAEGYLESLRGKGEDWMLNFNYFSGGSRVLGHVESFCAPTVDFVSEKEFLVETCLPAGARRMMALDTDGRRLWEGVTSGAAVWPLLVNSPDGLRLARETLAVSHPVTAYSPIEIDDVKGQLIRVFDASNGNMALAAPVSPALDAGGNVAISPSGRRVASINAGAIEVFELSAPPPLPDAGGNQPAH